MDATPLPVVIPNPVVLVQVVAPAPALPPPLVPTAVYRLPDGRIVVVPVVYGSVPQGMFAPVVPQRMPAWCPPGG